MRALGAAFVLAAVAATSVACGKKLTPAVPLRPPVTTTGPASKAAAATPPRPTPLPGVSLGSFGEGTFGPRVARNGASAIVVSAPHSPSGRRWMTVALDPHDVPIADARSEVAEAPEDSSAWDVKPVGDGFVLAWTKPTDAGEVLQVVSLAADGAPRGVPVTVAKSGDDLVAVRIVPAPAGTTGPALLTFGERTLPKGATAATGALFAVALDALGRPIGAPTKIEERLSAWQVAATSSTSAVAVVVQRVDAKPDHGDKGDKPKKDPDQIVAHHEIARTAKAITIGVGPKGVTASDPVLLAGDEVVPEVEVVPTAPGRALAIWSDRRGVDAQLWSVSLDVSGPKPKPLSAPRRALPPRGDQAIVSVVPLRDGAAVLYEIVTPRSIREPGRRFQLARLSSDGESVATPRAFWFPYEGEEPELARAGDDDVAVLTYGAACMAKGDAAPTCDRDDLRPFILRFSGPTLAPKSAELLDTGPITGGAPKHAFDLACREGACSALVEGPGPEAIVAIAKTPGPAPKPDALRWVYRELVDPKGGPPRLEGAGAIGREAEFTGLHAVRAGQGALVGWITYAPDEADVEPGALDKGKKAKKEPKKKAEETGARVAVRLVDSGGEPLGPIASISERALSKGDVAVAWSTLEGQGGVVAYVSRAEGDEEVYVARVDKTGKKAGSSSRITNAPGTASDVALTALPEGGYLLAWVDGRKGSLAVWAVRLDKSGAKVGAEVRVGGGQGGDLSDLALATIGSGTGGARVAAVWSDARDGGPHGFADVWYAVLSAKDLAKPISPEKPVAKTKTHSHGPVVTARGDGGALVAWLEDDPTSSEFLEYVGKAGWGPWLARIDANGAIAQASTEVALDPSVGKGVATSVAADCPTGPSSCRLAVAWAVREGVVVLGATGTQAGFAKAQPIWSWYGAPSQEVAPAIVGHSVFVAEDGLEKDDGRVRRLSVTW